MKTYLISALMLLLACTVHAQKDVTTFLGIPVDGFKTEMKRKLIAKGFTPTKTVGQDFLEGEFNGTDVHVYIVTNNNKVYRIMLADVTCQDEANIKIRFNNLVRQFKKNKRYFTVTKDCEISDDEDISYEMTVHNKIYEATFFQEPNYEKMDSTSIQQLAGLFESIGEQQQNSDDNLDKAIDILTKKTVWFRIGEFYGKYYINMYYDNRSNQADGEDL